MIENRQFGSSSTRPYGWLYAGMAVVGAGVLIFTALNFLPLLYSNPVSPEDHKVPLPDFELSGMRGVGTGQGGRYKPFESAAIEIVRQITGRSRLQGNDAAAIVLMWMLELDYQRAAPVSAWDQVPFILCEQRELRKLIYTLQDDGKLSDQEPTYEQIHGKFISPDDLRPFRARWKRLAEENRERFRELNATMEQPVGQVLQRLQLFESISRNWSTEEDPDAPGRFRRSLDPLAFVALDQVPGSPWFSIGELRQIVKTPDVWAEVLMKDRVKTAPQLYISKEHQAALEKFQASVQAGTGRTEMDEVARALEERQGNTVKEFEDARATGGREGFLFLMRVLKTLPPSTAKEPRDADYTRSRIAKLYDSEQKGNPSKTHAEYTRDMASELATFLKQRDALVLKDLSERLPAANARYQPDDPKYRMLHLTYLETRFPDVYQAAMKWQPAPIEKAQRVLASFEALGEAYRSGDAASFARASEAFLATVKEVSEEVGPYPGQDTIADRLAILWSGESLNPPSEELLALEQSYNRVQPFLWAWILMLVGVLFLTLSMAATWRGFYVLGLSAYAGSLGFQCFGFFTRIIISGRPPVSNMYETVIWVAFMSAIFALILEAIYRRRVIALAGALVSTIGLILADQLPLALDPKINPLVPVLRSNFWLTVHVLTIVSSYAGGTLAWGLGNITLVLIVFGSARKDTIKMLAQFTYRAMQIAVLLLAAGTFLGGWWAAYSWGRFWGWDPKETGALIALVCYVIPLHMRFVGWIKDFGMAVAAILCYAAILSSWYGVNFLFPAGLHSYGVGSGGGGWVYWACLLNIEWVLLATFLYWKRMDTAAAPSGGETDAQPASLPPPTPPSTAIKAEHAGV